MDNELLEKVAHVTINYTYMGFSVDSKNPVNAGGSACGGCASSGGCGGH